MGVESNSRSLCLCGCEASVRRSFLPGHDAKLRGKIIRELKAADSQRREPDVAAVIPAAAFEELDRLFKGEFIHLKPGALPDPMDNPEIAAKVADYLKLPYTICFYYDDEVEPVWMAYVEELEGCMSHGSTPAEAMEMIHEAMELWIGGNLEDGDEIPPPKDHFPEHSGKFQVRLPVGLHGKLAAVAREQEVSLNQLVTAILAEGVGWRPAGKRQSSRT